MISSSNNQSIRPNDSNKANQKLQVDEGARNYIEPKNESRDSLLCALSSPVININHSVKKNFLPLLKVD